MRILGLDPGLRKTGWGIIEARENRLRHIADGVIAPPPHATTAARLTRLFQGVQDLIREFTPDVAAIEQVFVNRNAGSALKLGQARGVVFLAPSMAGLPVAEYAANLVKKAVVGAGHAEKRQIDAMVRMLLPGCTPDGADAADALAVAICHAHHAETRTLWAVETRP